MSNKCTEASLFQLYQMNKSHAVHLHFKCHEGTYIDQPNIDVIMGHYYCRHKTVEPLGSYLKAIVLYVENCVFNSY